MKVSCLQENLVKALDRVSRIAPKSGRGPLPQCSHVLLATDQGRLKLTTTDLETAFTTSIGAGVDEEGALTVPVHALRDYIKSLPKDRIDLSNEKVRLLVVCGTAQSYFPCRNASDFPPTPTMGDGVTVTVEPAALGRAIKRAEFAAASDDTRPVLTGVHITVEDRELTLAAADGFRLAVHKLPLAQEQAVPGRVEMTVPVKAMRELQRLIAKEEEPVGITFDAARVLFHLQMADLLTTAIAGSYPDYSQLIPQAYNSRAVIDVHQFSQEVQRAAIVARDGSGVVRLQVVAGDAGRPARMIVSARMEEFGEHRGEIDVTLEGESANIAFDYKYLRDALWVLDCSQVALETTAPDRPGVIRPIGQEQGAEDYLYMVMPMFIDWKKEDPK